MKKPQHPASCGTKTTVERRSGIDRRQQDAQPPSGGHDRRRSVEARKPDVVEVEMTTTLWDAFGPSVAAEGGGPTKS